MSDAVERLTISGAMECVAKCQGTGLFDRLLEIGRMERWRRLLLTDINQPPLLKLSWRQAYGGPAPGLDVWLAPNEFATAMSMAIARIIDGLAVDFEGTREQFLEAAMAYSAAADQS